MSHILTQLSGQFNGVSTSRDPTVGGTTFWRLVHVRASLSAGLRKGVPYGGYRWEKFKEKAVVGMCANPLERVHSILVLLPLAWNFPYTIFRVSRCNTAVRPFTSKFRPRTRCAYYTLALRTSGTCTRMQGIASYRQCSVLTVEPNSGHLSSGIFPPYCKYELPSLPRSDH